MTNNPEQLREIAARYHGLMGPEAAVLGRSANEIERLHTELERELAAADTVRRSNAAMLTEIDRWQEDAERLATVVESNRKCHGCGMLCRVCSDAYAASLIEHKALAREAGNE